MFNFTSPSPPSISAATPPPSTETSSIVSPAVDPPARLCLHSQKSKETSRDSSPVSNLRRRVLPCFSIWDLASGRLKLTLTGQIYQVRGLAVSSKHTYMFSAGDDKLVKCWDLEQNKGHILRAQWGKLLVGSTSAELLTLVEDYLCLGFLLA